MIQVFSARTSLLTLISLQGGTCLNSPFVRPTWPGTDTCVCVSPRVHWMWWGPHKYPPAPWKNRWTVMCVPRHNGSCKIYLKNVHLTTVRWNPDGRHCDYLSIFQSAQFYFWPRCCVAGGMWSALVGGWEGVQRTKPDCLFVWWFFFAWNHREISPKFVFIEEHGSKHT